MAEVIMLICTIGIIVPLILITAFWWNLKRNLKGLESLEGTELLKDILKNVNKKQSTKVKKVDKRSSAKKPIIEDAEFRETTN